MHPLSWEELEQAAAGHPALDAGQRIDGVCNSPATLRLFGQSASAVRVTLFRDHHAWCPYCQKVWLWLEERRIPYRIRKVTMVCYGEKEPWYRRLVPSGMLPAVEIDGRLITDSDSILQTLESSFGSLGVGLMAPESRPLRQLERLLFRSWCQWLCQPHRPASESTARLQFQRCATAMEEALCASGGPFLLGTAISSVDVVAVPFLERMNASLAYYKGSLLRQEHPAIDQWLAALERRTSYLGTQSDFHTHVHDLPPQLGGCYANGTASQCQLASQIDAGPWPIRGNNDADQETSQPQPVDAATWALARVLRHRTTLLQRNPIGADQFDPALRTALSGLIQGTTLPPPATTARGLRHLRDRICAPRDMPLHAARLLRTALEATARCDPELPEGQGAALPTKHRHDQDPKPFLNSVHRDEAVQNR